MASSAELARLLKNSWLGAETSSADDYWLIARVGSSYAARTKAGLHALVIPLEAIDGMSIGRRAAGCELTAIKSARFRYNERDWTGAAAILVCQDSGVLDAFTVLAADVVARLGDHPTWQRVLEIVEEWQTLLSPKGKPNAEGELGLWGELWFLASASNIPLLLASWRGPEGDSTDFFFGGASVEVKTSRHQRQHHVSMNQVSAPVGEHDAWFLSIWVKEDPMRGVTVTQLVQIIEGRCEDHGELHRRLLRAGYSVAARNDYTARFAILEEPEWYAATNVPTIRAADPGVSDVRYRVRLDKERACSGDVSSTLWKRFWMQEYGGRADETR